MKTRCLARLLLCLSLFLFSAGITGCKSTSANIKWDQRVGIYTYEMAKDEFGRPSSDATLADGTHHCQWLIQNRSSRTYKLLYGSWLDDGHEEMDEYLTLSFDAADKLRGWKTVYK